MSVHRTSRLSLLVNAILRSGRIRSASPFEASGKASKHRASSYKRLLRKICKETSCKCLDFGLGSWGGRTLRQGTSYDKLTELKFSQSFKQPKVAEIAPVMLDSLRSGLRY
jgi:hypothetical protein